MKYDPIIIAGPPRSGTTMLAGLLSIHGVWVGRGRTTKYPGTNSEVVSENQDIKNVMKATDYKNWTTPLPDHDLPIDVYHKIDNIIPDERWLVKTTWTLVHWRFWNDYAPDAKWVFPHRPEKKVLDSMNRHPGMKNRNDNKKKQFVRALHNRQKEVFKNVDGYWVDTKAISDFNAIEINNFFRFVDIKPKWNLIREFIKPGMMK